MTLKELVDQKGEIVPSQSGTIQELTVLPYLATQTYGRTRLEQHKNPTVEMRLFIPHVIFRGGDEYAIPGLLAQAGDRIIVYSSNNFPESKAKNTDARVVDAWQVHDDSGVSLTKGICTDRSGCRWK